MTLPGVDYTVAQALLAALGDLSPFTDADHAASYLGLVPSTRQLGKHCYHGPITKRGNAHARGLLVQAAQHLDKHPGPLLVPRLASFSADWLRGRTGTLQWWRSRANSS